jgi:hypothetical protein
VELLAERGIDVDHVTVHGGSGGSPRLVGTAGFCRQAHEPVGSRCDQ